MLEAPRCAPYYLAARAPHFAWQHDLGPRDTLASVALRYHCDMVVLRRYNNLMSEAGVACRTQLYVPGEKCWGGRLASGGPTIAALKIACQSPAPPCAVPCRSVRPGAGQGLRGRLCEMPARRAALRGRVCPREGPAQAPGPRDAAAGERQDHPHAGAQSPHRPLHGPVLPQQPLPEPARRHLGIWWVWRIGGDRGLCVGICIVVSGDKCLGVCAAQQIRSCTATQSKTRPGGRLSERGAGGEWSALLRKCYYALRN